MIVNTGTARIAPGTLHLQYLKLRENDDRQWDYWVHREPVRQQHRRDDLPFYQVNAEVKGCQQQGSPRRSLADQSDRQEENDPEERAEDRRKFRQNAIAPQSTGPGTSDGNRELLLQLGPGLG